MYKVNKQKHNIYMCVSREENSHFVREVIILATWPIECLLTSVCVNEEALEL